MNMDSFHKETIDTQFCVVGGGMAGVCAAVAAARSGVQTVLVQDRPMLGGNASSEIRMWICGAGAQNPDMKESGILEEIQLENLRWNPSLQYNIWDHVLIQFVQREPNLKLLLNCTCDNVSAQDNVIDSISAWQLTTQKKFVIHAECFADCSGDSVLRTSGAEFRSGREARSEFHETHAPEVADNKTMGNSILIQTKRTNAHKPFNTPPWAHIFQEKGFHRSLNPQDNFWWIETGGEQDTIADSEEIRDELLKIVYGVWDLVKNGSKGIGKHFDIEWIGVLPGKRENIRYEGDWILNQNDVEKQGRFDDIVAYGGWSMDDHHPAAFYHEGAPTIFHPAPSPYGIPLRCLYSKNIKNLFFAGRNISATHMAMSSTRVMGTCAIMGQAVGSAAALAIKNHITPRQVYETKIAELQKELLDNDAFLPWRKREIPDLSKNATLFAEGTTDVETLRSGEERAIGEVSNCFVCKFGTSIEYWFGKPETISSARIVFDSELHNCKRMRCFYPDHQEDAELPESLIKEFSLEVLEKEGSEWKEVAYFEDNYKRLVKIPVNRKAIAIRLVPEASWGCEKAHIFSFDVQ